MKKRVKDIRLEDMLKKRKPSKTKKSVNRAIGKQALYGSIKRTSGYTPLNVRSMPNYKGSVITT